MLKNYLKTSFRSLWKNKGFSAINIIGLATGLATCLLIILYVLDELSYDKYNLNADRYLPVGHEVNNSVGNSYLTWPRPLLKWDRKQSGNFHK